MAETDPIFPGVSAGLVGQDPIYQEKHQTRSMKVILGVFLAVVAIFIAVSIIVVSVQSWKVNPIFIILLVNLLAFSQIQIFMVLFVYSDRLSKKCFWAIFLVGIFVILQSISTDILVFTI